MNNFRLPELFKIEPMLKPAADAAGRSSGFVTLKFSQKAYLVCYINQGNAAQVTLTPNQAQNVAGTGAKVLSNPCPIWYLDNADAGDTLVLQTSATSFTTSVGLTSKVVIFEIDPAEHFDLVNGFTSLNISTSASNAANITSVMADLLASRFAQATPPTALSN